MVTQLTQVTHQSYLTAGQRYVPAHRPDWPADNQITILIVARDLRGTVWVTFRSADGRHRTSLATQFEAAVAGGEIVPLTSGPVPRC